MSASSDSRTDRARVSVVLPTHLHARPAGRLAQVAGGFQATIRLEHDGRAVDPVGILSVMGLGATAGSEVTVHAEGPDALPATQALAQVLAEMDH
jgi:phosphotransferase system HPr (HPr) family protein